MIVQIDGHKVDDVPNREEGEDKQDYVVKVSKMPNVAKELNSRPIYDCVYVEGKVTNYITKPTEVFCNI